jgi:hypothetical protein
MFPIFIYEGRNIDSQKACPKLLMYIYVTGEHCTAYNLGSESCRNDPAIQHKKMIVNKGCSMVLETLELTDEG